MDRFIYIFILSMYFTCWWAAVSGMDVFQDPLEVSEGEDLRLVCSVPTPVGFTVRWRLPNGDIATTNCNPNPAITYINATCDVTDPNMEYFILHINDVIAARDDGNYTCYMSDVNVEIGVEVHVRTSIVNWHPSSLNITEGENLTALCSTGCGYPAKIKWYKIGGDNSSLPSGTDVPGTSCNDTAGYEKLRNVTSTLVIPGVYMTGLACCVENTIGDRSECHTINTRTFDGIENYAVNEEESSSNLTGQVGDVVTADCSTHCVYTTAEYEWLKEISLDNITISSNDTEVIACNKYPTKQFKSTAEVKIEENLMALICCANFVNGSTAYHRIPVTIDRNTTLETNNNGGLGPGEIAGIVIGCALFIALIVLLICCWYYCCAKKDKEKSKRRPTSGNG